MNIMEYDLIKDGVSLVSFKSMVQLSHTLEASVTSQPVEEGSFTSINKVVSPQKFEVRLGFVGTDREIASVIATLELELKNASTVQIVSPLGTSPKASITKFSYSQNLENGRGGLLVDLSFEQIKEVSQTYTDTAPISTGQATNASDVSNTDSGKQQTTEVNSSTLNNLGWFS